MQSQAGLNSAEVHSVFREAKYTALLKKLRIELRSNLLPLGITDASIVMISLNRSLAENGFSARRAGFF